jgi:hypothetical protein
MTEVKLKASLANLRLSASNSLRIVNYGLLNFHLAYITGELSTFWLDYNNLGDIINSVLSVNQR